jgi:hypothetical protein
VPDGVALILENSNYRVSILYSILTRNNDRDLITYLPTADILSESL